MKISIIIPVYNTEKYLRECLDSVLKQTYKNIEIVIVNDGSVDNSVNIIEEYRQKYENIVYIYQENQGQSVARNKGLEVASGDYIMFVDSDDYIDLTMVEKLMQPMLEDNKLDLTFCNYYLQSENAIIKDYIIKELDIPLSKALVLSAPSPCLKVFKKSLLTNFKFPENIIYEDFASMPLVLAKSKKHKYIKEHLYYYRQHNESTTRNMTFSPKKMDIVKAAQFLLDNFKSDKSIDNYKEEIEYLIIEHLILMGGLRFSRYPKAKEKLKLISDFVKTNNLCIEKNSYYQKLSKIKKRLIRYILKNNILGCYIFFLKRKLKIGGYNEV